MQLRTTVVTPKAASPRGAGLAIFGKVVGSARAGFAAEAIRISYSFGEELPRSKCGPSGEAESRMSGESFEGKARRSVGRKGKNFRENGVVKLDAEMRCGRG